MNKLAFLKPFEIRGKTRLGKNSDGGYVVYGRLLKETDVLMTYGIGWEISFEEHFNRETGKKVLMFDPTLFSGNYFINTGYLKTALLNLRMGAAFEHLFTIWSLWRKRNQLRKKNIFFINEGLAKVKSNKYDTLAGHIERFRLEKKEFLLKIDIEGGEYDIFEDKTIYKHLRHVNQLIIELHDLKNRFHFLETIVAELRKDFILAHIHANNFGGTFRIYDLLNNGEKDIVFPDVLEILFVRRDKVYKEDLLNESRAYPIAELDYPNNPRKKDLVINFV